MLSMFTVWLDNTFMGYCWWRIILIQAGNYMFKVNDRNTGKKCEICLKLKLKKPERRQWLRSGVFIVNFEQVKAG